MSYISLPKKIYFKQGCLPVALDELNGRKRAFLIGGSRTVESKLNEMQIQHICYSDIPEALTKETVRKCLKEVSLFEPDVIIAIGGASAVNAGKLVKLMYDKTAFLVTVPTQNCGNTALTASAEFSHGEEVRILTDTRLLPDMVIMDRSEDLTSLEFAFQEMFA